MVITGLTRNQFVPKAHEGSNPSLCAKQKAVELVSTAYCFVQSVVIEPCTQKRARVRICEAYLRREAQYA